MIKALVFDFDGVIIDTEKARYDAWQTVFFSYGQILPIDEWVKNIGRVTFMANPCDILMNLIEKSVPYEELHQQAKIIELKLVKDIQLLPGITNLIQQAQFNHLKIAIASSSTREWVEGHLKRLSIYDRFDTLVCREDTNTHKPSPEPYLTAVKRLGCKPQESMAIEDSPLGIESAISAGLKCIAVGCSITQHLDLSRATINVKSLENFQLASVW